MRIIRRLKSICAHQEDAIFFIEHHCEILYLFHMTQTSLQECKVVPCTIRDHINIIQVSNCTMFILCKNRYAVYGIQPVRRQVGMSTKREGRTLPSRQFFLCIRYPLYSLHTYNKSREYYNPFISIYAQKFKI